MLVMRDNSVETFETENQLGLYVSFEPTIEAELTGLAANSIFSDNTAAEGVVVLENGQPVGVIMRTAFYQKFGSIYGHSLYMNRSVKLLMDTSFMSADIDDSISKISIQAMSREQEKIYDFIVVMKDRTYFGVISIRHFLMELSKRNDAQINILKAQQFKLISANDQEVRLRQDIEYRSTALRNLMDHADQGFLLFEQNLTVRDEYSYKCIKLFSKSIAGANFVDLVKDYFPEEKISVFHFVFASYFKNDSSVTDQVYLMLLPADCIIGKKHVHFEYRSIENNGQKAVMAIMNDVTEKIRLEKAIADDQNKQRLIIKAFGYQAEIKRTLHEFRGIANGGYLDCFSANTRFDECYNFLHRTIHTLKGDFAQFGFMSASQQLHEIEDRLGKIDRHDGTVDQVAQIMSSINAEQVLEEDLNLIYDVLGKGYFEQSELISVSRERLAELKGFIIDGSIPLEKNTVINLLSSLERKNIKIFLNQYSDYLDYLSGRLMKNKPMFVVEGDDIEIEDDMYSDFFKSLVHIYRNIIDHAIETDEERTECGKPGNGLIVSHISKINESWLQLCISDDGRGIDLERVAQKAVKDNLCTPEQINCMTSDEIANLILCDGLTTKDDVDSLSGRGIGMAAVAQSCQKLGGKISVSTKLGQGTVFTFTLPYSTSY